MNPARKKKATVALGVLVFVVASFFSVRFLVGEFSFTTTFEKVSPGLDEAQVLTLLGSPDDRGKEFRLGQFEGYEKEYQRASESSAKTYWFWFRGIDVVYTVGFDESGKVVIAEYGGT